MDQDKSIHKQAQLEVRLRLKLWR